MENAARCGDADQPFKAVKAPRSNCMELIVRAVDVGSGNTKFVTGISGAEIRCASFPSVAYPSSADTSAMPAAGAESTPATACTFGTMNDVP